MLSSKTTLLLSLLFFLATHLYSQPVNWDVSKSYNLGDLVVEGTSTYIAKQGVPANSAVSNTAYWENLATAASTLSKPVEEVPNLDINTILNSIPDAAPTSVSSSAITSLSANDILIENTTSGERAAWSIYGNYRQFITEEGILTGGATIGNFASTTKLVASGDFNGDSNEDLVTQESSTGDIKIVFLNNANISSSVTILTFSSNVNVVGAADFDSDGKLDLLSENVSSGAKTVHHIAGSGTTLSVSKSTVLATDASYRVAGVADFNSDGKPDLIAEQLTTSADPLFKTSRQIWYTNGTAISSKTTFLSFDQEWTIINVGDFDLDDIPDLMVEQYTTGRKGIWYMTSNKIREGFEYVTLLEKWKSRCSSDINKDGCNDALFQDSVSGNIMVLYLGNQDGSLNQWGHKYTYQVVNRNFIPAGNSNAGPDWKMRGFIDHDSDGTPSILAENTNSGACAIWTMDKGLALNSVTFKTKDSNVKLIGSGNFGGDSAPDIVTENLSTGEKKIWLMSYSSGSYSLTSEVSVITDPSYSVVGIGDFNKDANLDLVVEEKTSSNSPLTNIKRKIWFMNGTSKTTEVTFLDFVQEWRIKGTRDFDGNGTPDLIVEQDNVGRRGVWYMSGSDLTEGFIFGTVDPSWQFSHQ
jgi:hypothetical protein